MKAELVNSTAIEKTVKVVVDWDEIADDYATLFSDLRRDLKIDGFRQGKVPESLAKRLLKPKIFVNFTNQVIEKTHKQALEEVGIGDYLDLHIVDLDFDENQPFNYTIKAENDPEIALPDYKKGIKISHNEYIVDPETVDRYIEDFLENQAEVQEVFDGAQDGDFLVADLQALDESDIPLIGKRLPDRLIKVGEGIFGGKEAGNLIGVKAGDSVNINVKSSSGKPLKYLIDVKRVEKHTLPELTDELVKSQVDGIETVAEFRQRITENLQYKWNQRAQEELDQALADYFIENTKFDIPPYRINSYLDSLIEKMKENPKNKTIDEAKIREEYLPIAEKNIRWYLIQRAIGKQEDIQVSEDEIQSEIDKILQSVPEEQKEFAEQFYRNSHSRLEIKVDLIDRKILDHIHNFIKEKKVTVHTESL
ncbi:MAG TPA: trigger factor [Candidatus Marinimicrobia bacterium]|nr:trigger factor [Candidatus Neomarinimicrobiota bacterium]HRS51505.1 trigger factor [Candidatus Neomarinimicrobiota bacterium]HRU92775.1 trigger factor [Candidatus Neomarinimicrobiota bacterium]